MKNIFGFKLILVLLTIFLGFGGFNLTPKLISATHQTTVQQTTEEDEFKDFDETADTVATCNGDCASCPNSQTEVVNDSLISNSTWWIIAILATTVIAGVLVRFKTTRKFRILFLLGSVVFFGVYRGTCPCMISSFENFVLTLTGADFVWYHLLWFIGLIPITYLFGRVFCGWICHLGALQELLYRPGKFKFFTSKRARIVMKVMQYVLFATLVIQLIVQQEIFWCKIDPFLAIYQLMLAYNYEILSIVLISLLLITSLLSYRPFCRAACPVGLVLGWIEKIPGATIIGLKNDACISCVSCSKTCDIEAIYKNKKQTILNNEECIMCGECMDSCLQSGLGIFRVSKKRLSKCSFDSSKCENK